MSEQVKAPAVAGASPLAAVEAGLNLATVIAKHLGDRFNQKYIDESIKLKEKLREEWDKYPQIDGEKIAELVARAAEIQDGVRLEFEKLHSADRA